MCDSDFEKSLFLVIRESAEKKETLRYFAQFKKWKMRKFLTVYSDESSPMVMIWKYSYLEDKTYSHLTVSMSLHV